MDYRGCEYWNACKGLINCKTCQVYTAKDFSSLEDEIEELETELEDGLIKLCNSMEEIMEKPAIIKTFWEEEDNNA